MAFRLTPPARLPRPNGADRYAAASTRPSAVIAFTRPSCDVAARVPATCAGELDAHTRVIRRHGSAGSGKPEEGVVAAGASHRQRVVARPVEVDEDAARHEQGVERLRTVQPLLLGHREQELERAVRDLGVVDDGHRRRDADAVVRPERRAVGRNPVVVDANADASLARVERARRIALAHHVEVCLEDDHRRVLAAGGRGHANDDVALVVDVRSSDRAAAHASTCSRTGPSAFDGRGISVSSKKRSQTSAGSSPVGGALTGEA